MPYPSLDLLEAAATNLQGCHPLSVITVPALLRAAAAIGARPTELIPFGSQQENVVLDAFRVNDSKTKPYLAIWKKPPALVNHDYAGSTLQRLRTQDILGRSVLHDDSVAGPGNKRAKFGLREDAGERLASGHKSVDKASLAAWLLRSSILGGAGIKRVEDLVAWFDEVFPLGGTDLSVVYSDEIPASLRELDTPFVEERVPGEAILDHLGVRVRSRVAPPAVQTETLLTLPAETATSEEVGEEEAEGLAWTREVCEFTLQYPDPNAITSRVLADLEANYIELPDAERLVRRCVTALLVGHLILQGPPGTGKTTLARALARGFNCEVLETTATSDWSPFHVIGGLRPNPAGGLSPVHGKVTEAALRCVNVVRAEVNAEAETGSTTPEGLPQAAWLFIDEFNRADIDKAIGSLYTALSSCDPQHLASTPLDLWFEVAPEDKQLWIPARFRIIGAMNDLDTSFVNRMSQGLTRRFQFVTVGVPTTRATVDRPITSELENAFKGAHAWLDRTYGATLRVPDATSARDLLAPDVYLLQRIIDGLRYPNSAAGWQVGTAQIVDILRVVLMLRVTADQLETEDGALDNALADRLVPQMAGIDEDQFSEFKALFNEAGLTNATAALAHLLDPHSMP